MSCCDNSLVSFCNLSGFGMTVVEASPVEGTIRGASPGTPIVYMAPPYNCYAFSARQSRGEAKGTVTLQVANGTQFKLNYAFTPSDNKGHCPCTASVEQNPIIDGGLKASAVVISGSSDGGAQVNWTVSVY